MRFLEHDGPPPTTVDARSLVRAFERGTLDRRFWNHRAHCLVGLIYLLRSPIPAALADLRRAIRRFNEAGGVPNTDSSGYHETLTRTYVAGLAEFLAHRGSLHLDGELLQELWRNPVSTMDYARARYSEERLWSARARRSYVEPDLVPSPVTPREPVS